MQGLVLTQTDNLTALLSSMRQNKIPLVKVVTSWGWHWDEASRRQVCEMPAVIVRTLAGDGHTLLDPQIVLDEVEPWLSIRPSLSVELGNEPNATDASDDAAWAFRWYFLEAIAAVRQRWPAARLISPGLIETRQQRWWEICQDAFSQADAVGFHAYAYHDFTPSDTGQIQRAIQQLYGLFPSRAWAATELGINDPATPAATKATRYSALHAKLPSHVTAACWYHYCLHPIDGDQQAYQLPTAAFDELKAGGTI